ncbi:MAG: mechanosensitive ion channel domain-containing protein [Caldisphaera sp.]
MEDTELRHTKGGFRISQNRFSGFGRSIIEIAVIIFIAVSIYIFMQFLGLFFHKLEIYMWIVKDLIELVASLLAVRSLGNGLTRNLLPKYKERAISIGNLFKILGYLIVIVVIVAFTRISTESALFGGTVTGLVLGLALQPVLGNLFAGLIILGTRFIKPGDIITVLNWQIPYQWTPNPGYKFFSPDYIAPGFKGRVLEIGLFSSSLVIEQGQEIKIPNQILLGGAAIEHHTQWSDYITNILRVEIPIADIKLFESKAKEVLSKFGNNAEIYISEQSDKNYVIYLIKITMSINEDWLKVKDSILRQLIAYKQ